MASGTDSARANKMQIPRAVFQKDIPGCLAFSEKSLILFEFIDIEYKTYSEERIRKMEAIRNRISDLKI